MEFRELLMDYHELGGSLMPGKGTHNGACHSTTTKSVQCDML